MRQVFVILLKDLRVRKNHIILTVLEILLPIGIILLLNCTAVPEPEPPDSSFTNDTINIDCDHVPQYSEIYYEPLNNFTHGLMTAVECLGGFRNIKAGNIDKLEDLRIGVKFKGLNNFTSGIPEKLEYEIYPYSDYWEDVHDLWENPYNNVHSYSYGTLKTIMRLQHAIDEAYLYTLDVTTPLISFRNSDLFSRYLRIYELLVMLVFFIGFSLMVPGIVGRLVEEKLSGAKEMMQIMGLKRNHLWVAKLLDCVIIFGFVQLFIVIFMYIPLNQHSHVLQSVPPVLLWMYMMYALIGVFIFLFFFSCLFKSPTFAVFMAEVVWCFSFALFSTVSIYGNRISKLVRILCCLFPHFCFFNGLSILLDFDFYKKPVRFWEVLSEEPSYPTVGEIFIMITVDIVLYSTLIWYSEQVSPGSFGIKKPATFCFKKSYWFPQKTKPASHNLFAREGNKNEDFETVPDGAKIGISIQNVSKEYRSLSKGTVLAIDNVSIDFYSGEITSLLGHNGAGKTTMFSVISGLTQANAGNVVINEYDLTESTKMARKNLGLCPQHDMLFTDLNVYENLTFYGMIKGLTWKEASREANEFIAKLKLSDVKTTQAGRLSGGQKRKTSLAIALIGGSKVVLLDEPTSGLDPEMRRELWDMLMEFRGSRTILLTTHFMEEADALSNRIAIMDHGQIKCYGTPLYLKSKYGSGYTLSVVVRDIGTARIMEKFIQKFVESAKLKSQNVLTLAFQLPQNEVEKFPSLLSALDKKQTTGEVYSYSVSYSTFEDVFIRLRGKELENETVIDVVDSSPYKRLNSDQSHVPKVNYIFLPFYQIYALLIKKCIYFSRNFIAFLLFVMVPILFIIIRYMILPAIDGQKTKHPQGIESNDGSLPLSLDIYSGTMTLFTLSESGLAKALERYVVNSGLEVRRVMNISEELVNIFQHDFYAYSRKFSFGVDFNDIQKGDIHVFYNSYGTQMLPVSLHAIYNGLLLSNNKSNSIRAFLNMKYSYQEKKALGVHFKKPENPSSACFLASVPDTLGIPVLFFLIGPLREKSRGAKHLQLMTTSSVLYWLAHLLFDAVLFIVYLAFAVLLIFASNADEFNLDNEGEIITGFILWAIGLLLLTYVLSSFMKNLGAATALIMSIYCVFTFLVYTFVQWEFWNKAFRLLHPSSILKIGFHNICIQEEDNFNVALLVYNIVVFAFLILKDSHILAILHRVLGSVLKIDYSDLIDKDGAVIEQENHVRQLVARKDFTQNSLVVNNLRRWFLSGFRPRATVRGISFAVENGECFGFLGVNGAGKTTSFKMMTGDLQASQGQSFVNGYNLFFPFQQSKGLFHIGYCPQYGGYIPSFKGSELLALFARLRGITVSHVTKETRKWFEELDLLEHANTPIEKYSGGNQRKLLVGVALIGGPPVVLLDEPTSGVDPVSRRLIWKIINNLRREGKSVLLTSHSMDECEAVCTRLAIMVRGTFRCFGEVTTLKDTFGKGFTVQLKISSDATAEEWNDIKEIMVSEFGLGCDLTDEHLTMLEYHISDTNMKWDFIFMKLINLKERYNRIESFSASATTLEQIFISCARDQ